MVFESSTLKELPFLGLLELLHASLRLLSLTIQEILMDVTLLLQQCASNIGRLGAGL